MMDKFSKMIWAFAVVMVAIMIGCSEDGAKSQKQQQTQQQEQQLEQRRGQQQVEKIKVDETKLLMEEFSIETDEKKLDSLVELKVKKKMEKDSFRLYVSEVKKYNDSLDQIKGNRLPHKPDPEVLFRKMMKECLKKGMCN
ncbi:hypothetical protein SAMN05720766_11011 [Fibrobacter sp. UWH9]|uniref:hypothetical protein n=1 Tax=Fibrobacter sp. UWH9 TaxID=1896213 RepID=UPI000919B2EC|nr:hypothetical protein [Fibrobacter sp. UWH9]SHH30880.1 hypothetical protein SAMN05720766_11011 [Fibrobacter sp. UWH9]